jgi:hypothetical protein
MRGFVPPLLKLGEPRTIATALLLHSADLREPRFERSGLGTLGNRQIIISNLCRI